MPDRIIRDELTRSHRYRTLSSDTSRLLFVHIVLSVDSLGNMEATSTAICDALHRTLDDATVARLLSELADVDLIRLYSIDGKPYLHVPRFRQRMRYLHGKHPRPPKEIECKEIRALLAKVSPQTDRSLTTDRPQSDISAEVKRSEVKNFKSAFTPSPVHNSAPTPPKSAQSAVLKDEKQNPGQQWGTESWVIATGATLDVHPRPGESSDVFRQRVWQAVQQRRQTP